MNEDVDIGPEELKRRLDDGERPALLDIREPFEWEIANLEPYGARLVPMAELEGQLESLDADEELIVYCRSGNRSSRVVRWLRANGFPRARNLDGGILAWSDAVDPSVQKY